MSIKSHLTILSASLLLSASSAFGQELSKEVEIRYQETPQLRETSKLALDPTITLPSRAGSNLRYSTSTPTISVNPTIATLEPTSYLDTIYTSPYRGYASIGFMPKFNLAASAGYKILDTDHTRLNAWMQYDGTAYRGNTTIYANSEKYSTYFRRNTATIGADLHQAVGRESFIDAGIDYTFARLNIPGVGYMESIGGSGVLDAVNGFDHYNQNIHRLNLSAQWSMRHGQLDFGIGATFKRFAPTNHPDIICLDQAETQYDRAIPTRENLFIVNAFATAKPSDKSLAGIKLEFSHQAYNATTDIELSRMTPLQLGSTNHSMLSVKPFYRFALANLRFDLGVKLDLTFNAGKMFHIAPDAQATWLASDFVKVYIKATGGQHRNTLGSLYDINPYADQITAWRNSQVAVDAETGVTVGSWKGLFAQISFNYAMANDWLTPMIFDTHSFFAPIDLKGYRFRGLIGYSYRDIATLKASYEMAPQKTDRGYYLWADRAKRVINVDLEVHPTKALDINLGWEYRGQRATLTAQIADNQLLLTPLRSVNNLHASAAYHITPQWSAFVCGENLLNRHHYMVGGLPAQGITGLAGVTYKF